MTKLGTNLEEIHVTQQIPFSCIYVCLGCFLISYVLRKRIMASGNIPPQRREVVVRGDGNSFYRSIALWTDQMSDEKYEETHRLSSCLIEKNPTVFEPKLRKSPIT